jgi:hypothetical protein
MQQYAEFDRSAFPVVKVRFTGAAAQDENFELYLQGLEESYNTKENLAIIFDASQVAVPGLRYQQRQAQWLKEKEELMRNFCAGTAYIIPNIIIRNILKAIFAFQKQPVPYTVCGTLQEAEAWVAEALRQKA